MIVSLALHGPHVAVYSSSRAMQPAPFDQAAFLRDARSAAVESGELDAQVNRARLQKVRIRSTPDCSFFFFLGSEFVRALAK